MNNPIIDEVRRIRDEHAKKFDYDIAEICDDLRKHQKNCGHPVITRNGKNTGLLVAEESPDYGTKNNRADQSYDD
ncbi:hypothetical protein [Pontiella sulfatireligans]|uniref:Uncharacterized protein n=1 Tax=Pontiella sulfatireligans TaxID=2750658 RepID=A0A6C2UDZ2_9BACT|nr:hypothetical protein [Pontiella sulfatireligans]VGO18432.1 hypothetical protein SCARR_00485 [Pontiella sulfatireligans]